MERLLYEIASELPPSEIVVLAQAERGAEEFDARGQFKIYRLDKVPRGAWSSLHTLVARLLSPTLARTLLYLPAAYSLMKREQIDVVQVGSLQLVVVAYLLRKITGTPYLVYGYGDEVVPGGRRWRSSYGLGPALRNSNAIITISEYTRQQIIQWGVDKRIVTKIPLGAKADPQAAAPAEAIARQLDLQGKRVILTVGRLVEHKGHDMVLKALPRVLERVPDVRYLIVGRGPAEAQLRKLVTDLSLQDHVTLLGHVPDEQLPAYYKLSDLFVMLSRELADKRRVEGFGLVFLEANAWGKPVVGGRSGGVPDAVLHEVTGLLVDPTNLSEIADAMTRILSDPAYAGFLGMNGQRRVEGEMNWRQASAKLRSIVRAIVERRALPDEGSVG